MLGSVLGGLGGAIGGIAVAAGAAGQGGEKFLKKALEVRKNIHTPGYDMKSIPPYELQIFASFFPEEYAAIVPKEVQLAVEQSTGRDAQVGALDYWTQVRDQGLPLQSRLETQDAQNAIAAERRGGQEAILSNLAARGRLGGGTEVQARLGMDQQSMNLARDLGSSVVQQQIQARLEAARQAGGLGTQIRGQDIGQSQFNATAVNRFNEYASALQNQAARDNAMARQAASNANVGNRQRIGEENARARYEAENTNLDRQNSLRSRGFQDELAKAEGIASAYGNLAQARYAEQAARANNIKSIGQGVGSAVGGVGDLAGGGGALGGGVQGYYEQLYGPRRGGYY